MNEHQIFISYRRDGGDDLAGRLADNLRGRGYNVFYDIESMRSGVFNEQIYTALDACEDVLVVLPQNSLARCANEDDWVRKEIARAIALGKNIIPIMMKGFSFPEVLPDDIDKLRRYEGVHAISEYFVAMVDRLCDLMKSRPVNKQKFEAVEALESGKRFINYKLYDKAVETLENALQSDMSNPDVHFYLAVAFLEGKRPFLLPKAKITRVEEHLRAAIDIEEKALYYYFFAYLKKDFYENKALRAVPSSKELVFKANSLGLDLLEADELFKLLGQPRPSII